MEALIEESLAAAEDRRHRDSHMSHWVSINDLIKKTSGCSGNIPIPSKDLVRLQYIPKNPYTQSALNFTSCFQIQHKIQQRQLCAAHPDGHYFAALFKYLKTKTVEEKDSVMILCNDPMSGNLMPLCEQGLEGG